MQKIRKPQFNEKVQYKPEFSALHQRIYTPKSKLEKKDPSSEYNLYVKRSAISAGLWLGYILGFSGVL